ncbi:MAG: EscU/YscU/HrcU family type III secretion system export apparatus switch protein [Epsilonproteobacteria bacterium]|nr:EscU/YscU/HrcU family type III secretion system export apparatus switch protein [Campylobacterota bacterium]
MKKKEAVALKYNQEKNKAPTVTAKGKGKTAQKIIELAKLNDIPVKKDEDLVELLSKVELDKEIPAEMYKAVAEVFSFIYNITKKS